MKRITFYHPFNLIVLRLPKRTSEWDDVYEYGFSLDLTTELYFYTYDWGYGLNFRVLGFGFDILIHSVL